MSVFHLTTLQKPVAGTICANHAKAEPTDNVVTITIPNLPKGSYAAALYQDKNSNDKMDKNVLGIPTEKYGFSNNTALPDWKKNSFELNADMSIMIKLR